MKNRELIENYNRLFNLQREETEYHEKTGKQLLGGRVKVMYAVKKNMTEFLKKLEPYHEARSELLKSYENDETNEEFAAKQEELLNIDVEDVNIHKIDYMLLDGLELSSVDLGAFMCMID